MARRRNLQDAMVEFAGRRKGYLTRGHQACRNQAVWRSGQPGHSRPGKCERVEIAVRWSSGIACKSHQARREFLLAAREALIYKGIARGLQPFQMPHGLN